MRDGDDSQPVTPDISTLAVDEMTDVDARLLPHPRVYTYLVFLNSLGSFYMAEFSQEDELVREQVWGRRPRKISLCFGLCQALPCA